MCKALEAVLNKSCSRVTGNLGDVCKALEAVLNKSCSRVTGNLGEVSKCQSTTNAQLHN